MLPVLFTGVKSLMKIWEKMKSESKTYYGSTRRNNTQTGGGPPTIKVDPILEQVCNIMGRGCTGIINVQDRDSTCNEATVQVDQYLPKLLRIDDSQPSLIEIESINFTPVAKENPEITFEETTQEELNKLTDLNKPRLNKTPLWSRRRPQMINHHERSDATTLVTSSIRDVYKKKESIENLKEQLLRDELEFKKKLYDLQLQAAVKDVEIKTALIEQIKGGGFSLNNLYGHQQRKD